MKASKAGGKHRPPIGTRTTFGYEISYVPADGQVYVRLSKRTERHGCITLLLTDTDLDALKLYYSELLATVRQ